MFLITSSSCIFCFLVSPSHLIRSIRKKKKKGVAKTCSMDTLEHEQAKKSKRDMYEDTEEKDKEEADHQRTETGPKEALLSYSRRDGNWKRGQSSRHVQTFRALYERMEENTERLAEYEDHFWETRKRNLEALSRATSEEG